MRIIALVIVSCIANGGALAAGCGFDPNCYTKQHLEQQQQQQRPSPATQPDDHRDRYKEIGRPPSQECIQRCIDNSHGGPCSDPAFLRGYCG